MKIDTSLIKEKSLNIIKKYIGYIVLIVIFLVLLLSLNTCNNKKINEITESNFTIRQKDSITIIEQSQNLVTKDAEIVKKTEQIEKLKNLKAQVVYKTVYKVKNILVPYVDSNNVVIIHEKDSTGNIIDSVNCLTLPAHVSRNEKNLSIDATINETGLTIDSLEIPDKVTITVGTTKNVFDPQPIVKITHTNPYVNTSSVNNIIVDPELKKKQLHSFLIGGAIGIGLESLLIGLTLGLIK